MNIVEACKHPDLFGPLFKNASWRAWMTLLRALFAIPMAKDDLALYQDCTGRTTWPKKQFKEAFLICGRRAGKSFCMAVIAVFLACFFNYRPYLNIGERGTLMVIAADRKQARTIMRYIRGLLQIPALAKMVDNERAESFDLNNMVTIEIPPLHTPQREDIPLSQRWWTKLPSPGRTIALCRLPNFCAPCAPRWR
ncbi:MAG: hypothetical protein ACR652_25120 [Methylocystis sp.]|uniref:hypothetical protein n=1 Tax=Methylocystis sp. TaxID=1911079 RepID=UPI003DA360EC